MSSYSYESLTTRNINALYYGYNETDKPYTSTLSSRVEFLRSKLALSSAGAISQLEQSIDDGHFDWINEKSDRQAKWLIQLLRYYWNNSMPTSFARIVWLEPDWPQCPALQLSNVSINYPVDDMSIKDTLICIFDTSPAQKDTKIQWIDYLRKTWSELLYRARKDFKWLSVESDDQVDWAWDYLSNVTSGFGKLTDQHTPITQAEKYESILSIFDTWTNGSAERRELLRRLKQAWSQKKYRSALDGRKSATYVLENKAIEKLKKMAKSRNVNIHQMLEHCIYNEFDRLKSEGKIR